METALAAHETANPQVIIKDLKGDVIEEGTPIDVLMINEEEEQLSIHPDAEQEA